MIILILSIPLYGAYLETPSPVVSVCLSVYQQAEGALLGNR